MLALSDKPDTRFDSVLPTLAQCQTFAVGEHVFHEGDAAAAVFEVVDGVVVLYGITLEGGRQLMGLRFPGELLGLTHRETYGWSAMAVRRATLRRIPRAVLDREIEDDPDFAKRIIAACTSELSRTRDQLMIVGCRSALGRVAALLLDIAERTADGGPSFSLPITRGEMGDYLGLTLETVSRAVSRLKALKIIALPRNDQVIVLDRGRLRDLADGIGEGASRGRMAA